MNRDPATLGVLHLGHQRRMVSVGRLVPQAAVEAEGIPATLAVRCRGSGDKSSASVPSSAVDSSQMRRAQGNVSIGALAGCNGAGPRRRCDAVRHHLTQLGDNQRLRATGKALQDQAAPAVAQAQARRGVLVGWAGAAVPAITVGNVGSRRSRRTRLPPLSCRRLLRGRRDLRQ